MKCLNCQDEMTNYLVQTKGRDISYDLCEACGSLWLDKGELDKMAFQVEGSVEYSSTKPAEDVEERAKPCPRCKGLNLRKVRFLGHSETVLDCCPRCGGFWLDGGELDLINRELERIMPVEGRGFSDFVNNVHVPYWHKRISRRSSETDFVTEGPPINGAEQIGATDCLCPACSGKLSKYKIFKIEIEGCPACGGVLLDQGELRKLKDSVSKNWTYDLRWMDDEVEAIEGASFVPSRRSCPKCADTKLMATCFGDSSILIDACPACHGVWLDGAEFQDILGHLRSKLLGASSKELAAKAYEEIKEIWSGPENVISEVLDAKVAVAALLEWVVFEHPRLVKALLGTQERGRGIGLS